MNSKGDIIVRSVGLGALVAFGLMLIYHQDVAAERGLKHALGYALICVVWGGVAGFVGYIYQCTHARRTP